MGFDALIPKANRVIMDTLRRAAASPDPSPTLHARLHEFDDVTYLIQASPQSPTTIRISLSAPGDPAHPPGQSHHGIQSNIWASLRGVAKPESQPEAGFDVTLAVDVARLASMGAEEREGAIAAVASARLLLLAAPLREVFGALAEGRGRAGSVLTFRTGRGEPYFAKPQEDSITVVFPIALSDSQDNPIACSFLQEFAETARHGPLLGAAPSCAYHLPAKGPPLELAGVPPEVIGNAEGGFMSLTFFTRHVQGDRIDQVLWNVATFRAFIAYHIKCSKAMFHTRMRKCTGAMMASLKQTHFQADRVKRTALGKAFESAT